MLDSATFIEVPTKTDCNLWVEKRINALAILAYENEEINAYGNELSDICAHCTS